MYSSTSIFAFYHSFIIHTSSGEARNCRGKGRHLKGLRSQKIWTTVQGLSSGLARRLRLCELPRIFVGEFAQTKIFERAFRLLKIFERVFVPHYCVKEDLSTLSCCIMSLHNNITNKVLKDVTAR